MMPQLKRAEQEDVEVVLPLVRAYHAFEGLQTTEAHRRHAVELLLGNDAFGRLFLVQESSKLIGYIALCYGFSIEFGGIDAFIDEFFLIPTARGRGFGSQILEAVKTEVRSDGVTALHLEVARENEAAQRLYRRHGFERRDKYLMLTCPL